MMRHVPPSTPSIGSDGHWALPLPNHYDPRSHHLVGAGGFDSQPHPHLSIDGLGHSTAFSPPMQGQGGRPHQQSPFAQSFGSPPHFGSVSSPHSFGSHAPPFGSQPSPSHHQQQSQQYNGNAESVYGPLMAEFIPSRTAQQFWDTYGLPPSVPWEILASKLDFEFVSACKVQSRHLSTDDLATIRNLVLLPQQQLASLNDLIGRKSDRRPIFWDWFDSFMATVNKVRDSWLAEPRRIYGLLSTEHANLVLRNKPIGTFLIRFSESNLYHLAVACVEAAYAGSEVPRIAHYLIDCKGPSFAISKIVLGQQEKREEYATQIGRAHV